ncbi:hypothetical protein Nepgr_007618 [Nepenthes gracilis]|uniref:Wax synthase domain-containing protein n=1 Tax=Nepenthes gracilis TaxID=150966 RepID=A0AAD3S780_NEPGR|nr:hypothetical protein Nepgr_007618 [Nepenthes gracilis]
MEEEREITKFLHVCATVLVSLCYCYFIVSKIPQGKFRLFSLLPIFSLFTLLPLRLSSAILSGNTAFFVTWLANFKLILFAFNLGPLSDQCSLPIFIFTAAFPIKIKHYKQQPASNSLRNQTPRKQYLNLWSKSLLLSVSIYASDHCKDRVPQKMMLVLYCGMIYLFIDIILGVCNKLVWAVLGLELEPPSDEPYLSTSLQDFWGRRWNLMVTDTLRHTVYNPVRAVVCRGQGSSSLAVMAAFIVSAIMHELIFFYLTRVPPTWEVTWFFVLHGLCVVVESLVKRYLGQRWRVHWAVSGPLTIGFLMGTGFWWFFPPLVRNHVDERVISECKSIGHYLMGMLIF